MQHEYHRVPVTALNFLHDDVVLAAEGSLLRAYSVSGHALLAASSIFDAQAIHGIVVREIDSNAAVVLIWGGRLVRVLIITLGQSGSLEVQLSDVKETHDWILDAAIAPSLGQECERAVLVTAHNALQTCYFSKDPISLAILPLVPGSNCILYSACVTWLSDSKCLIASGTAFGDIIVWSASCSTERSDASASSVTHYAFSAHDGSVFGVTIASNDIASTLGNRQHVLASCSDDRTIRLWDISDLSRQISSASDAQRQTGFGSRAEGEISAPSCLSKTMGHISRIWHVRLSMETSEKDRLDRKEADSRLSQLRVLSFGEDASCISWSIEKSADTKGSEFVLRQGRVRKAHTGKNIWSASLQDSGRTVTGGADGMLAISSMSSLTAPDSATEIEKRHLDGVSHKDNFKAYGFLSENVILATTEQGCIITIHLEGTDTSSIKSISPAVDGLRGYSIVSTIPEAGFIAGSDGIVRSYSKSCNQLSPLLTTGRKVAGLFTSQQEYCLSERAETLGLMVTNVGSTTALFARLKTNQEADGSITLLDTTTIQLPQNFVVTSFICISRDDESEILVGSRNGYINAYHVLHNAQEKLHFEPELSFCAHGKEAVTSLTFASGVSQSQEGKVLFSTGRDGTFAAHRYTIRNGIAHLETIHQLALPFGPIVEGIDIQRPDQILAWGFQGKQFVAYDIKALRETMTIDCGGAHRNWAFRHTAEGGVFAWTKASKLYFEAQNALPYKTLNSGGHGREIKSVAISPGENPIIATGAEDTNIKLSVYRNGRFHCLHTLQRHNTGIQHLQWSSDGRYLFSSGGFEEFFVWKLSYDVPHLGVGVICESVHPNSGTSDLRVMSFTIQESPEAVGASSPFDVTMVLSNSSVRNWRYKGTTWTLMVEAEYLTACLTQCLYLKSNDQLMTASTDGHVALWKSAQDSFTWDARQKIHQSAILSLETHSLADETTLIFSGGDDNAIGISRKMKDDTISVLLLPRAHAAAVTAITLVDFFDNRMRFVSAGIDQRVKLWEVNIDTSKLGIEGISVTKLHDVSTDVADVSSMNIIQLPNNQRGILVCGVGMDLWKFDSA